MKKILAILILFYTGLLFAGPFETEWYSILNTQKLNSLEDVLGSEDIKLYTGSKIVLGINQKVYYLTSKNRLASVFYVLPKDRSKQLVKKLEPITTIKNLDNNFYKNIQNRNSDLFNLNDSPIYKLINLEIIALITEETGLENIFLNELQREKGNGKMSIYDYNDDTRVYIFENINEEGNVVVYVPHQKDY